MKSPPRRTSPRRNKAELRRRMARARRVRDWLRNEGRLKRKPSLHHRRGYKVDVLPPGARAVVFDGFRRGVSYQKIRAQVQAAGSDITEAALGRYWRQVWQKQCDRLRDARILRDQLAEALQMDPKSPSGQMAREMLYTEAFKRLEELEGAPLWKLLKEARAQERVGGKSAAGKGEPPRGDRKPDLRQHLDQLYGPGVVVVEEVSDEEEGGGKKDG